MTLGELSSNENTRYATSDTKLYYEYGKNKKNSTNNQDFVLGESYQQLLSYLYLDDDNKEDNMKEDIPQNVSNGAFVVFIM